MKSETSSGADFEEKSIEPVNSSDLENVEEFPDIDEGKSPEERAQIEKRLLRKLDWHLIPWLTLLYLASFLDRSNIGNAKVDGLQKDIHVSDGQYIAALSLFFIAYSLFEPLTNILLKRFRPSRFIPVIMILWGITVTVTGLVHDFSGLAAARWFLGMTEAGLFPGISYYLSCWYKRDEFGLRLAIFFSASALAGSFGGLLAAAIAQMKDIGGKPGWAWIFILEGLATILIGIASYWIVQDFPHDATFISEDDRKRVLYRLKVDRQSSASDEKFNMNYFWAAVRDWKTWAFACLYMGVVVPSYAFALFVPSIIRAINVGNSAHNSTITNLLTVPPYAVAAGATIVVGYVADRTRARGWCNVGTSLFSIVGFTMLLASTNSAVKYAGVFLAMIGVFPLPANIITWAANNIEGVYKRGISFGFIIGIGQINGIVSSAIYPTSDAPQYYPGNGVCLAYIVVFLLGGSLVTHFLLEAENKKRRAGKRDHWIEGKSPEEIKFMGDQVPDFIYTT